MVVVHLRTVRLWYCAVLIISIMATSSRSDRRPGNRSAFEAARLKVLKTQTICGICGKPVDFSYRYPHPLSPTVDHIIPVSKGGHPSDLSNLQLAHRCCNRQKSDHLLPSPAAAALAAVGAAALADPPAVVASAAAGAAGSAAVSPEAASLVVAAAVDSADGADWKKKEYFPNGRGL